MAVAVAESKLPWPESPSTSFSEAMRAQSSSVFSFSRIGSCKMMPVIVSSLFARIISSWSASLVLQMSTTSTPISSPYLFLRLTYLAMMGLSLSRRMRSLGFFCILATWRA